MLDDKIDKHESYGSITLSNVSGFTHLFGSEARHHNFVRIEIHEADMRRGLSDDRHMSGRTLAVVDLSHDQFGRFITSQGIGMGTPCTIRRIGNKDYPPVPEPEKLDSKFQEDLKRSTRKTVAHLEELANKLAESNLPGNKPLGKKEQASLLSDIRQAIMGIKDSIPFIEHQFDEMMEKKVAAAIVEIESTVAVGLRKIGLETVKQQIAAQLPDYNGAFSANVPQLPQTIEGQEPKK